MPLFSKTLIASLLTVAAVGARAHAGIASAVSQPNVDGSLAAVGRATADRAVSTYAPQNVPTDFIYPQRAIDLPALTSLAALDAPVHVRTPKIEPTVEPVPAPNALALGLVMLGIVAFARIVRRFRLA